MGFLKENVLSFLVLMICMAIHPIFGQYSDSYPNPELQPLYYEYPEPQHYYSPAPSPSYPGQVIYSYTVNSAPLPQYPSTYYPNPPVLPPKPTPYYPAPAPAPVPIPVYPTSYPTQAPVPVPVPAPEYPTSHYPVPAPEPHSTINYNPNYPPNPTPAPENYPSYDSQSFIPILRLRHQISNEENHANFETGNGIKSSESTITRVLPSFYYNGEDVKTSLEKSGRVTYYSPEGHLVTLTYVADENGYHPKTTITGGTGLDNVQRPYSGQQQQKQRKPEK